MGSRVTPEKKHVPKIPDIPIAQKHKAKSHHGSVQRLNYEKDVQDPLSCEHKRDRSRKTAFGPRDFLELLQGSQHIREEMKPLFLVKEISLPPWYGRDKRCLEVMILFSDQRVGPPRKIFFCQEINVAHRIEIQIFYTKK